MEIKGSDQNGQWTRVDTFKRSNKGCFLITKPVEKKLIEDTGTYVYIGYAPRGTATSSASWFIERIDTDGNKTSASADYDQVWDNRASLTYL